MKQDVQFQSENVLMSVFGHLVLIAIMLISFSVVIERAKLVTPDRIQITEIDLKSVQISGNETKLQNTSAPDIKTEKIEKKDAVKQNTESKKIDLKQPTMVESESKDSKNSKTQEKKPDNKPAPKKKTVVRVNREVLTLNRTMTISVVDALRVALTRCWNIDTNRPGIEDIRLTAHLKMLQTGIVDRIWFESESRAETDPDFAYVLDTVKAAIKTCSPFSMLPRNEYNTWRDIDLTFYPSQGKIM